MKYLAYCEATNGARGVNRLLIGHPLAELVCAGARSIDGSARHATAVGFDARYSKSTASSTDPRPTALLFNCLIVV